jgi:hypothetical protein
LHLPYPAFLTLPDDCNGTPLKLWTPATYRIEVVGTLDESWSDRLGGMLIKTRQRADQSTVPTLTGRLRDQAELAGVLNRVNEISDDKVTLQFSVRDTGIGMTAEQQGKLIFRFPNAMCKIAE